MPCATRSGVTTSSAATRMTRPCPWTISSGSLSERNARSSSISASPKRSRRSAAALFSVARSRQGLIGVEAAAVKDVALTHLHYDHCGNLGRFPAARFHLQESEIHYATGRYMAYPKLSHSYEVEDVCDIVRLNYRRRIKFYNGDAELASGIELYAASLRLAWRRRCRPRRPRAAAAQWTATCGSWRADAAPSCGPPRSAPIARRRGELTGNRAGLSDHLAGLPSSQRGVRHHGNNGTGYCAAAWRRMEDDPHDQWGVEPMARFSIRAIAAIST
jgi:hypothetical protein